MLELASENPVVDSRVLSFSAMWDIYEAALPLIEEWLNSEHANVRRAVSEGLSVNLSVCIIVSGVRPEVIAMPENMAQYDLVTVMYPNYWGTMPMLIFHPIAIVGKLV